ncbi:MAG TPA: hypothetical protein VGO61_20230 [Steroidobacteraceae bacterium]|nr:hypothetical protein [Steroidobacteraceae bacterium]
MKAPEWLASCEAAIAGETDARKRAPLLFGRAYGAVERFRYDDALADLNTALATDPENTDYLRERAYVHGELSNFAQAIADLDLFIKQHPEEPSGYRERSFARHYYGDLKGSYDDRARVLELTPDSLQSLIARAEAALWLGRLDEATADATSAQSRAKTFNEAAAQSSASDLLSRINRWRDATHGSRAAQRCSKAAAIHKAGSSKLIGDCSRAFFEASTGKDKADALSTRSIAWLVVANSETSATEDMKMALAFDPANVERHINLGYSYLSSSHSWAANREFERALAIEKHWLALAGRAAARVNLGDTDGALADALESQQLHPNEAAGSVLADIAYDKGERDRARVLYLEVYRLGSRSDQLLQRLSELGVPDPDKAIRK